MSALVSVLMAVKNEQLYIRDALRSILDQSHKNLEIIIVDDNSSDDTVSLILNIASHAKNIKLLRSDGAGKVHAFNMGWQHCHGDYVVLFAGDDILPQDSILNRMRLLELGADVATGKLVCISENKKYDGIVMPKTNKPSLKGGVTAFSRMFASLIFPIPRELPNEDTWTSLCIKMYAKKILWTNETVLHYRIHNNNSVKLGVSFDAKSYIIKKRHLAHSIFLEKHKLRLTEKQIFYLKSIVSAEQFRQDGDLLGIILNRGISLKEKLVFLSYSNKYLYDVRLLVERYVMGIL